MREPKVIVGFETPSGCGRHHNTHVVHLTLFELHREVGARMESILDNKDNSGPLKELWDAIDFCQCDSFWVSDEDDDIQLHSDVVPGLADERPVSVLSGWLEEQGISCEGRR